jgi:all-trans-8'-apo-beta-carotenal 15,15'-oxygenase
MTQAQAISVDAVRSAPVPASPAWLGGLQDLAREHGFEPLRVEGRLPEGLAGTLFRNGPGRFTVGGQRIPHWFDGDGAVTAVRLEGGRALGASRLVQTSGLQRERQAGRRLFGGYGTPFARPFREMFLRDGKNTANTSVLLWQGRLFATCEAGLPHEVARGDLSTLGESTLDGALVSPFSAHSHHVPSRRTTYNFGVTMGRNTRVDVYALPDGGPARALTRFQVDGARLNHDFAATDRHLVFAFAPQYLSVLQIVLLRRAPVPSAAWKADHGTEIVVVPIDEPSKIVRFRVDAFLAEHVVNAYEDGGEVVIEYTHYPDAEGLEGFVGSLVSGTVSSPLRSELRRLRVDPVKATARSEQVLARPVELPRVSPTVDASRHRFTYCLDFGTAPGREPFGTLLKLDGDSGQVQEYRPRSGSYLGEGVFVPRPGGSTEDDGWVLTMAYDARSDASRLEVLDARAMGDGPVASCWFDHPIPFGFHGAWAPARG